MSIVEMELEPSQNIDLPPADHRPPMLQPLPVRLVTVDDATLLTAAGLESDLDDFYVGLLKFEREDSPEGLVYRADNFRLKFVVLERTPQRDSVRPLLIAVPRLREVEHAIVERELDYTRLKGISPGQERLCLQDPAGNWVEIEECRAI